MQSQDWPDLPFVEPNAYGTGRDGHTAMVSVIHYTAGSERATSAEDGASYDAWRTDGVSTHYFHDSNSTIQCVLLENRANAAFHKGNRIGIQHELCGTAQSRAQWLDEASRATIRRAAFQIVRDHNKLGIPFRRLSPSEVRNCWYSNDRRIGGICGHADITHAFAEDGGTHEDPGAEFPWDVLFNDIAFFRGVDLDVKTLVRFKDDPNGAVFLTDYIHSKWVQSEDELKDYITLHNEGSCPLAYNGQVRVLGRRALNGKIVGAYPPGWEVK